MSSGRNWGLCFGCAKSEKPGSSPKAAEELVECVVAVPGGTRAAADTLGSEMGVAFEIGVLLETPLGALPGDP